MDKELTQYLAADRYDREAVSYVAGLIHERDELRAEVERLLRQRDEVILDSEALKQGLWDTWAALGFDTDGDSDPGAWISGSGLERFIESVVMDAGNYRRQVETDFDEEATAREKAEAKVARVEARAKAWASRREEDAYYGRAVLAALEGGDDE